MSFANMSDAEVWQYGAIPSVCGPEHIERCRAVERELATRWGKLRH